VKRFPFRAVIIVAALIAAVFLFLERAVQRPNDSTDRRVLEKETPAPDFGPARQGAEDPVRSIVVIIDDIGFDLGIVQKLASIPAPLAFAVLPYTPYAGEAAGLLHAAGKEILLHLPMESLGRPGKSPGEGALTTDMNAEEIRDRVREILEAVPFISGVNNHMGSRFMEDEARLAVVMEELRARNLFFVDSMTTETSRGRKTSERAGVRFAARDVFIDHVPGYGAALKNLTGVLRKEPMNDLPILMIGHPRMETERAIRDAMPVWRTEGVKVIPVSACFGISHGPESGVRPQRRTER